MGVVADFFHQFGAQRVGYDIPRNATYIFVFTYGMVVKCLLP